MCWWCLVDGDVLMMLCWWCVVVEVEAAGGGGRRRRRRRDAARKTHMAMWGKNNMSTNMSTTLGWELWKNGFPELTFFWLHFTSIEGSLKLAKGSSPRVAEITGVPWNNWNWNPRRLRQSIHALSKTWDFFPASKRETLHILCIGCFFDFGRCFVFYV